MKQTKRDVIYCHIPSFRYNSIYYSVSVCFYSALSVPKMKFTAFSALAAADIMNLLSFFKTCNQFWIYAALFLKVCGVSMFNIFKIAVLPISATNSSFEYVSLPKAATFLSSNLSSLVLCPGLCVSS